jgi:hypothetical protein
MRKSEYEDLTCPTWAARAHSDSRGHQSSSWFLSRVAQIAENGGHLGAVYTLNSLKRSLSLARSFNLSQERALRHFSPLFLRRPPPRRLCVGGCWIAATSPRFCFFVCTPRRRARSGTVSSQPPWRILLHDHVCPEGFHTAQHVPTLLQS